MRVASILRLAALAAAVAWSAGGVAAEPKTTTDFNRAFGSWLEAKLRSDFQARGRKDADWAARLGEFHRAFAAGVVVDFTVADQLEKLERLAADLAAAGCDDPIFQVCRGRIDLARNRPKEALAAIRSGIVAAQKAGYPPVYALMATYWSRHAKVLIDPKVTVPNPDTTLFEIGVAAARDPSFTDGNQTAYVRTMMPEGEAFQAFAAPRFARPDSGVDPWIAAVVVGRDEIRRAWEARGSGSADEVTPEGWKGFQEHLARAREQLTKAHEMHPEFPEAAAAMITVSMGDGSDEERLWFDRAVAAQFDHEPAYRSLGLNALLPRWGGSHEEMLEFGRQCLDSGRFDTIVPSIFLDAVLAIGAELPGIRDALAMPGVYDDCVRLCRGYVAAKASPQYVRLWQSHLAMLQWLTGHYADACATLDELQDEPLRQSLDVFRARLDDVVGESRLFGGPHAEAFAAAEELIAADRLEEARAAYESLARKDGVHAAARKIVAARIATLKTAVALARYDWVDLQPPADLAGWRVVTGDWKAEPDGTLVGTSGEGGRLKLLCEAELGPDLEVTAECDLVPRPAPGKTRERITFLLAHAAGEDRVHEAICVRFLGPRQAVQVGHGAIGGTGPAARCQFEDKNALRIVLWDGKLSVFVNGKKVFDKLEVPAEWLAGGGLGVGEYAGQGPAVELGIRKLRARRLDKAPDDF